jgi:3-oxoacyl-[acyl-carrier protein] reductase
MTGVESSPVAVVTGAAGGLGSALAGEFSRQGWNVAALCHHHPSGEPEPSPSPLVTRHSSLVTFAMDVTDSGQVSAGFACLLRVLGRIDVLVNNAGTAADGPLPKLGEAAWDRVLDTNLKGAFLCSRAAAPAMAAQGEGSIINIASFSGRAGSAGQANYSAAKAGLFGLTSSLAVELGAPRSGGIRVNAVLPGFLDTPMTRSLSQRQKRAAVEANALKRLNTTAEAARFVVFLAGMRNVSGQVFQLDSRLASWA